MNDWLYCSASIPILATSPRKYRECGTWCHEDDCGTEYDRDTRTYALTCPECGSTEVFEAFRCEYTNQHGDQCTGHAESGYSMCTAHLPHDDDWQAEREEAMREEHAKERRHGIGEPVCPF